MKKRVILKCDLKKELIRQRVFLVRIQTRVKNRIHVLLDRLQIARPQVSDLFGKTGMQYLKNLNLEGVDGEILEEDLKILGLLQSLIREAESEIEGILDQDERVRLLRTIPGVGPVLSALIALEIDEIGRFSSPKKLACYAGLVPSTYSSGGKTSHGRIGTG